MQLGQVFLLRINFCYFFLKSRANQDIKIIFSFLLNTCNGNTLVNNSTVYTPFKTSKTDYFSVAFDYKHVAQKFYATR